MCAISPNLHTCFLVANDKGVARFLCSSWFLRVAAGFTKDSMKLVQVYRATERYEQSSNTAAVVNAKYQSVFLRVRVGVFSIPIVLPFP